MPDEEKTSGEKPLTTIATSTGITDVGGASSSTTNDTNKAPDESSSATNSGKEVADNSKKRPHDGNNNRDTNKEGGGGNKKKSKKSRSYNNNKRSNKKDRKKNHTWRKEDNKSNNNDNNNDKSKNDNEGKKQSDVYVRNFGSSKTEVHAGSYACPKQRELFNVTLPPHLIPPITGDSDEKKEEYKDGDGQQRNYVKRKVAFMLAYLGTGYSGFQANEGQKTLQGEFELALLKCGFLSPLNMGFYHKYGWSTSGRTDKGVHAAAQVCSAKIQLNDDQQSLEDVRYKLNQELPEHFRVLDVTKTTKKFCAKTGRSRVRYQYMIPAFCLRNRAEMKDLLNSVAPVTDKGRIPGEPLSEQECNEIKQLVKDYRVSSEQLQALQMALHKYEGTHSFHNFTNKLTSKDPSATRYMMSFNAEEPMIFEDGTQWIPTQVVGQSFLIHQIRKMVSVAVDSVRLGLPDLIDKALDKNNNTCRTDLAPAQGLFMEMSFYDMYNERLSKQNNQNQTDIKELKWHDETTEVYQRWKKFRDEVLMDHIVKEEGREGNFLQHLYNHEFYFDHLEYYGLNNNKKDVSGENDNKTEDEDNGGGPKEEEQ